ncbi:hypothetical protein VTN00DRAFT_9257 [Thermoascus crustaceus]|uniref:uncharacterized protein n=1 Tax=Thermoascus crustaceus TaxID=5088 RepID=UPI003742A514
MPSTQAPPSLSSISSDSSSSPVAAPATTSAGHGNGHPTTSWGASSSKSTAAQSSFSPVTAPTTGFDREKPRLTEQEKKSNHIASEQKRRAAIREGFDRLTELVPGLEGQGRSESIVLRKTVEFMRMKLQERRELIAEIESRGGRVDDAFRR